MPHDGENDEGKVGDFGPNCEMAVDQETLGDVVPKIGFGPAKVGRKTVSQGKRREN